MTTAIPTATTTSITWTYVSEQTAQAGQVLWHLATEAMAAAWITALKVKDVAMHVFSKTWFYAEKGLVQASIFLSIYHREVLIFGSGATMATAVLMLFLYCTGAFSRR